MYSDFKKEYALGRQEKPHLIFRYKVRARVAADAVKKHLNPNGLLCVLDLGAAEGLTLLEMRSLLGEGVYTGIESSDELIQSAPALPDNVEIIKGDATRLSAY